MQRHAPLLARPARTDGNEHTARQKTAGASDRGDLPGGSERGSHCFAARLPQQFDAVIHLDETQALEPLERTSHWEAEELPETYPSAL